MGTTTKKEWMGVYDYATGAPHSFMYYNTLFPKGKQVMMCFKKYLTAVKEKKARISLYEDEKEKCV